MEGNHQNKEKIEDHYLLAKWSAAKWLTNNEIKCFKITFDEILSHTNEGLIKAIRSFDKNKGFAFSTYAVHCMNNEVKTMLRKERKYQTRQMGEDNLYIQKNSLDYNSAYGLTDSEESKKFNKIENFEICERVMRILTEKEKRIIRLLYFQGFTIKDVAEKIGRKEQTVRSIKYRAMIKMKDYIARHNALYKDTVM